MIENWLPNIFKGIFSCFLWYVGIVYGITVLMVIVALIGDYCGG